ncbi:MAG TPA: chorismate mutase [candidate division Zixibacteria bacterium]|nr:chorismate mutase [candidate division Zixibacteria bacterium]MDD4918716.1 chorismate mutase [candidate division Zixibacteria bacterium]MDM7973939.1 chorismate mutase [candidate division Zixibacteria bacterium]HOD65780.1 chorismate mutase [candidate division Zixibacteria bacterium]HOZ07084.1 chorismate mutase [candidate division Zixibacteria bacterium]
MTAKGIDRLRDQIDALDRRLLSLLNERAGLVLDLARLKRADRLPVFDPAREKQILEQVVGQNRGPLPGDAVARLFERIIDESRRLERTEVYDTPSE